MRPEAVILSRRMGRRSYLRGRSGSRPRLPTLSSLESPGPMSDGIDQDAAMNSLRAPAGREVVDRVTAERLGQPHLRAVDVEVAAQPTRIAELESELSEERDARRKAEDA